MRSSNLSMKEASRSRTIKVINALRKVSPKVLTTSNAAVGGKRWPGRARVDALISAPLSRHPGAPTSIADDSIAGFKLTPCRCGPSTAGRHSQHTTSSEAGYREISSAFDGVARFELRFKRRFL